MPAPIGNRYAAKSAGPRQPWSGRLPVATIAQIKDHVAAGTHASQADVIAAAIDRYRPGHHAPTSAPKAARAGPRPPPSASA